MGKVKLFPSPEYTSKQPKDSVVPVLLGPSKSGKTVALISMILEQYRGCLGLQHRTLPLHAGGNRLQ